MIEKAAAKAGKGAAQLDGKMIDAASARMAENIVNIDKAIRTRKQTQETSGAATVTKR